MNQTFQIILIIMGCIASAGICAGGVGYLIKSFKKGTKEEKGEIISTSEQVVNFWKSQAENLQLMLERKEKDWNEKFQGMSREMGELRGQLTAEKVQNDRLEKIFQNRNPEQEKFMELVVTAINNQNTVNAEVVRILGDIHGMAVEEHNRETKVETVITRTP